MFTGLVEETGIVKGIEPVKGTIHLTLQMRLCADGLNLGDSIAVNGCCLTAAAIEENAEGACVRFDLLQETWDRTNLSAVAEGSLVNLERSLLPSSRLGGHFVTGHIDGTGEVVRWEKSGKDHVLEIIPPKEMMRYFIHKGSVAVDGISLTVSDVMEDRFRIWIIPHTFEVTALQERNVGDQVNLEPDMLGKYVERFLALGSD